MKITKVYLKQVIKEELQREHLKQLIKEEIQKEGLMDFFGGGSNKDWQNLVQKLWPKQESQQPLTPQEVAQVISFTFDRSTKPATMATQKGMLSTAIKGKGPISDLISQMDQKTLNDVLNQLDIENSLYAVATAKLRNPNLMADIHAEIESLTGIKAAGEKESEKADQYARMDQRTANRAAGIKYDQDQAAAAKAKASRDALDAARKEREREEAASTKNARRSGF